MERLFSCLIFISALPLALVAQQRPNVVILLADDLGWRDVGYHGGVIETPNIDRLAEEGIQLDRFYVYPVCSPTRAGLMTGRSSMRTGVIYSVFRPWENGAVPLDERLMPQAFHAAGYQTAGMGKWHLGHSHPKHFPLSRGFDSYYGHVNGAIDYYTKDREGSLDWFRDSDPLAESEYATELLANEAVRVIESRDRSKPLFLYMPFLAVHSPYQAPEKLIDKYARITPERRRILCAMGDAMDQAIGRVLDALDRAGMRENTIVLFFSDNGGVFGVSDNAPLRNGKASTFEGGIRIPAIVSWPAKWKGRRKVSQVMTNLDVFPTLAAAAGVEPGNTLPFDGRDMSAAIADGTVRPREDLFFAVENSDEIRLAVIAREWKLVRIIDKATMGARHYLFRIEEDPYEKHSLASAYPETVKELVRRIEDWRKLYPAGGVRFTSRPHPGWIPPKRWADRAR